MKILVLDAFKQAKASYNFNRTVDKVLRSVFGPLPFSCVRIGLSDLDKFAVDVTCNHGGESPQMLEFDKISIVIADGSATILPWSDIGLNLTRIAAMILVTGKPAVCFGCVSNCMAFALATGGGEPPARKSQIELESGDFYEFLSTQEFKGNSGMPSGNVGMTSSSSKAFSRNKRSQSAHRSNRPVLVNSLSTSTKTVLDRPGRVDKIASIRPEENSHFSVANLPSMKIVIQHPSDWQISSNAIACGMYAGRIIAQLSPGLPVLFHVRNSIDCAFHLHHSSSSTILFNSLTWLVDAISCERIVHVKTWDALCSLLPVRDKNCALVSVDNMRRKQDDDENKGSHLPSYTLLPLTEGSSRRPRTANWSREKNTTTGSESSDAFLRSSKSRLFTTDKLFPQLRGSAKSKVVDLNLI